LQEDRAHREAGPVLLVVLRCMLRATWRSHGLRAERQQALAILMGWFGDGDQTTKWIADECAVRPTPERAWLSLTTHYAGHRRRGGQHDGPGATP
jgi:hypothetical protein